MFPRQASCIVGKSDRDAAIIGDKITMFSVERYSLQLHIPPVFVWLIILIDTQKLTQHTLPLIHSTVIHKGLRVKPLFSMCDILSGMEVSLGLYQVSNSYHYTVLHLFLFSFLLLFFQTSTVLHYHSHSCSLLIVLFLKLSGSIIA